MRLILIKLVSCGHVGHSIWADAAVPGPDILQDLSPRQPESSKAAIEAFQRIRDDEMSFVSCEGTWGTWRASSPSISNNYETAGNSPSEVSNADWDETLVSVRHGPEPKRLLEKTDVALYAAIGEGFLSTFPPFFN